MIKFKLLGFLWVLVGSTSLLAQSNWQSFRSDQFGFSLEFPKEPATSKKIIDSDIGQLTMNMFNYVPAKSDNDANQAYFSNCVVYPANVVHSSRLSTTEVFFRSSIDRAVKNLNGTLITEIIIDKNGYPGREAIISVNEGKTFITTRIYLALNRMYTLQVLTPQVNKNNASIRKFLNSFELLN